MSAPPPFALAALDVAYAARDAGAAAAWAGAPRATGAPPFETRVASLADVAPYQPGAFYARELPALQAVLAAAPSADLLLIDGYAMLDASGRPGLGAHLFNALGGAIPVIGCAKSAFRGDDVSIAVTRGAGRTPLHVTAIGLDPAAAAKLVAALHGDHRLPEIVKAADRAARAAIAGGS